MDEIGDQSIRIKLCVDPGMDELYLRLAKLTNSGCRDREAIQLMKLGVMCETLMTSGGTLFPRAEHPVPTSSKMLGDVITEDPSFPKSITTAEPTVYPDLASLGLTAADFALPSTAEALAEMNRPGYRGG